MRKFIVVVAILCVGSVAAQSLPQFSLTTGNKCISCHIVSQGGGLRNELGAYAYNDVALIKPESLGLDGLYSSEASNSLFDGALMFGMDWRLQNARGHTPGAARKNFPMQAAFYAQYAPLEELKFEGSINAGHRRFGNEQTSTFPGQRPWMASALIQPSLSMPTLRVGLFSPTFGMRYDDHSKLIRQYAPAGGLAPGNRTAFIPPNFAEYGAELTYDGLHELTLSAGVFGSNALSEISYGSQKLLSGANKPTFSARALYWKRFADDLLNTYVGASALNNDDVVLSSGLLGVGLTDVAALMVEYSSADKPGVANTSILSLDAMITVTEGLNATARWESGATEYRASGSKSNIAAAVLGAQIFLLPYIELRPEYRIMDTDSDGNGFASNRWSAQVHVFY